MKTMVQTPPGFRFKSSEKDERLLELFQFEAPRKLECPKCDGVFYREVFEKKLRQFLENQIPQSEHLIEQLDTYKDLLNWECPKCRESVSLEKAQTNYRKNIPNNGDSTQ